MLKTFTPDLPGDFAGGILQVETRDFPKSFLLQTNLSLGGNTESTFRSVLDYDGGKLDWLGFDDGTRALPDAIPSDRVTSMVSVARPMPYTPEQTALFGRSLGNTWAIKPRTGRKTAPGEKGEFQAEQRQAGGQGQNGQQAQNGQQGWRGGRKLGAEDDGDQG